jgi:tripartite-type tricarboxylate transporter receptor subunit TctC
MPDIRRFIILGAVIGLSGAITAVHASENYPQRPVRFVIPQSPGGASDTVGRLVAQHLAERLGTPFVVDNRPGATGNIGAELVKNANPDGYTMLLTAANLVTSPPLYPRTPFDPVKDFAPITQLTLSPNIWVVHPTFPAQTMKELIAVAKSKPGQIDFSSSGLASTQHLAGELLNVMTGIKLVHIPYKGGGPALVDLIGGRVPVMVSGLSATVPHIKSGKIRALGITSAKRSPAVPEVPTVAEAAGLPDYEAVTFQGLVFPARTPQPIVERVSAEAREILAVPEVRQRLTGLGFEPVGSTPKQFAAFIRTELDKWGRIIREAGIKVE